jgi:ABC-2 type transport system ATP-binding protein
MVDKKDVWNRESSAHNDNFKGVMGLGVPALKIENLGKSYRGIQVVKNLNLVIEPGEIFGLLGPNGAGKSTTINMVTGVARVDQGQISIFGEDNQRNFRFTRSVVGVMHQEIVVDPFFEIGRALKIHSGYYGVKDDPKWRNLLIERLALGPHLKKTIHRLSGGMKRRFMVAKALIHKPRLLILDEPTAGVDVELRKALWEFVREINQKGTTVLLTTHYLDEAEAMCGRIAIMNRGELVALDQTKKLMTKLEKKRVTIHLRSPVKSLPVSFLRYEPKHAGNLVEFSLAQDRSTGEILDLFYKEHIEIEDIETAEPSLEEVFVKMTQNEKSSPAEMTKEFA